MMGEFLFGWKYYGTEKPNRRIDMKLFRNALHIILIVLTIFLALSAIPGGVVLLANFYAPPVDMLAGSMFKDFTIPGLSLALIVGGSALFAAILLFRKSKFDILFSAAAGIIIMFFEFVEMLVIGSPAGPARIMQIMYFGLGTAIVVVSIGTWFLDLRSE
jgi:hypothetical protein